MKMILLILLSTVAMGKNANPLIDRYHKEVLETYNKCKSRDVSLDNGLAINYCHLESSKSARERLTIILPGNKEPMLAYMNLGMDIKTRSNDDVVIVDQIGQGESDRPLKESQKIYVENFGDYITSVEKVLNKIEKKGKYMSLRIIGHSMGSLIGFEFSKIHFKRVEQLVLSSPMFRFLAFGLPDSIVKSFVSLAVGTGFSKSYAIGQGPHERRKFHKKNLSTNNPIWYEYSNFLYHKHPNLRAHGNTFMWVNSSYVQLEQLDKNIEKLSMPIYMYQATDDGVVDIKVIAEVCNKLKNCQTTRLEGAKHDLFRELDIHQRPILETIFK